MLLNEQVDFQIIGFCRCVIGINASNWSKITCDPPALETLVDEMANAGRDIDYINSVEDHCAVLNVSELACHALNHGGVLLELGGTVVVVEQRGEAHVVAEECVAGGE